MIDHDHPTNFADLAPAIKRAAARVSWAIGRGTMRTSPKGRRGARTGHADDTVFYAKGIPAKKPQVRLVRNGETVATKRL